MIQFLNRLIVKFILRSRINILPGRRLFFNDGGLISNIVGRYIKKRDSRRSKLAGFKSITNNESIALNQQGFVISSTRANSNTIRKLADQWDRWVTRYEFPEDGRLQLSSADLREDLSEFRPLLESLISEDIKQTLESYFDGNFRIINYHIYRNKKPDLTGIVDSYGATANWHTDGSTSESIKLFFMLSDVTETNGPMEIISREDTKKVIKSKNFCYPDKKGLTVRYISKECEIKSLQGQQGSYFFASTNDVLHRATIPNDGETRDLLVFYITSSPKKRDVSTQLESASYREILGLGRFLLG